MNNPKTASAHNDQLQGRVEPEVLKPNVTVPNAGMGPNNYTRDKEELVKEFERETEEKTMVVWTDGVHQAGIETTNYLYVVWLESRLLRQRIKTAALESALSAAEGRLREIGDIATVFIETEELAADFYSAEEIAAWKMVRRLAVEDAEKQEGKKPHG